MTRVIAAKPDPPSERAYWTMSRGTPSAPSAPPAGTAGGCASCASRCRSRWCWRSPSSTLVTYFNPLRMLAKLPIDVGNLVVSGTKITMEQPRLSGFYPRRRAYSVSAESRRRRM